MDFYQAQVKTRDEFSLSCSHQIYASFIDLVKCHILLVPAQFGQGTLSRLAQTLRVMVPFETNSIDYKHTTENLLLIDFENDLIRKVICCNCYPS